MGCRPRTLAYSMTPPRSSPAGLPRPALRPWADTAGVNGVPSRHLHDRIEPPGKLENARAPLFPARGNGIASAPGAACAPCFPGMNAAASGPGKRPGVFPTTPATVHLRMDRSRRDRAARGRLGFANAFVPVRPSWRFGGSDQANPSISPAS